MFSLLHSSGAARMDIRLGRFRFTATRLRLVVGLLAGLYLANALMPLYWWRAGADECTFGPVTGEQYRDYLRAAERELRFAQFWMPSERFERARRIAGAIKVVSGDSDSLFVRLAAMHAVMRAINAQHSQSVFRSEKNRWGETYNAAAVGEDPVLEPGKSDYSPSFSPLYYRYNYSILADRFSIFSLTRPFDYPSDISFGPQFLDSFDFNGKQNRFGGSITDRSFYIGASGPYYPNLYDTRWRNRWGPEAPYGPCPVVPSAGWVQDFVERNHITNVRP